MNRSTNIPASGQKATMLRRCCRKKSIENSRFLLGSPQCVTDKDENTQNHYQGVILGISGLKQPNGPACGFDETTGKTDEAIHDPPIPPIRAQRASDRIPCCSIDNAVHNL